MIALARRAASRSSANPQAGGRGVPPARLCPPFLHKFDFQVKSFLLTPRVTLGYTRYMTTPDVLFWGGVGGAVLGGLWYGLKTLRESGSIRAYQGSANGHKSASDAAQNGTCARRDDEHRHYSGEAQSRSVPRRDENQHDRDGGGSGGGAARGGFDDDVEPERFRSSREGDGTQSLRFEVSELRREIERLARSFDELNSEVTRRINRANARLARAKGQDDQPELPGTETAGSLRVKSDLRKIAQERLLAKRGRRMIP